VALGDDAPRLVDPTDHHERRHVYFHKALCGRRIKRLRLSFGLPGQVGGEDPVLHLAAKPRIDARRRLAPAVDPHLGLELREPLPLLRLPRALHLLPRRRFHSFRQLRLITADAACDADERVAAIR
jgi:hypothetical protein